MNVFALVFVAIWLGITGLDDTKNMPNLDKLYYRAAKYSMPVDYTRAHEIVYGSNNIIPRVPKNIVSNQYYIQYGENLIIDILDPGEGMEFIGNIIIKWDYANSEFSFTHFMDHVRKYRTTIDSIPFSLEESKGTIRELCKGTALVENCDSVNFILYPDSTEFTILVNHSIPNITSHKLFYPDIKYLPTKIEGLGYGRNTLTLDEMFYGKQSIDSLLQLYVYDGYEEMTDEDLSLIDRQSIIDLLEEFKRANKSQNQ